MTVLFDQVDKFISVKEHWAEVVVAEKDWHRKMYMNLLLKKSLVLKRCRKKNVHALIINSQLSVSSM